MEKKFSVLPISGIALAIVAGGVLLDAAFQISKFSFLSKLKAWNSLFVIVNSLAILLVPVVAAMALLKLLFLIFRSFPTIQHAMKSTVLLMLSFLFTAIVLTHLDTWVYTVFKTSVADIIPVVNKLLLLALTIAGVVLYLKAGETFYNYFESKTKLVVIAYAAVFTCFGIASSYYIFTKFPHLRENVVFARDRDTLPNIILFSSDGLDASHLDIYGYERDTTHYMEQLSKESIVFNRAYANGATSRGSVASILTGKSPATTKVLYPPDILQDEDAFQHLPGILADLGYYRVHIGDGLHVSPAKTNFLMAFHREDGASTDFDADFLLIERLRRLYTMEFFFLSETLERIVNKVGFMAGFSEKLLLFRRLEERFKGLHPLPPYTEEERNFEDLLAVIRNSTRPVFAHIHLLRTHGPMFHGLYERRFSSGKPWPKGFDPDYYDDAIVTVDYLFGKLLHTLESAGKLQNTLIIIHTDHNQNYEMRRAVPLIVHLPGQREKRSVDIPVQYVDIAPSLLNYLGIGVPDWMDGNPVFGETDISRLSERHIYTFRHCVEERYGGELIIRKYVGPPVYGVCEAGMVSGDFLYLFNVGTGRSELFDISVNPQRPEPVRQPEIESRYREALFSYMRDRGIEPLGIVKGKRP